MPISRVRYLLCGVVVVLAAGCERTASTPTPPPRPTAPLYEGMGRATLQAQATPAAQRYFEQGMQFTYGFDFTEAERAFQAALQLDPACALCAWGLAYVTGPNINRPEREPAARLEPARRYLRQARRLAAQASARERALVEALALRLEAGKAVTAPAVDRSAPPVDAVCGPGAKVTAHPADRAYAEAMAQLARAHPGDIDAAVLYSEALLMLSPWDWWRDGAPLADTQRAIEVLERVLAQRPEHVGANHFLIHAFEQSPEPERALAAATRLPALAPAIGHLVHMPAHIYMRLGRYADASRANQAAIAADGWLAQQAREQGFEPFAPPTHHLHFLWASRSLEGQDLAAFDAATLLAQMASRQRPAEGADGNRDYFLALPYFAHVRFARWGELLAMPAPEDSVYAQAVWHWARGMAQAHQGRPGRAFDELAELEARIAEPSLEGRRFKGIDELRELLEIAAASLRGEALLAQKRFDPALQAFGRAVALEDALESEEPPPWAYSTRVALGSAQLLANRPGEAEASFRADLKRYPNNAWALYGLAEALRRQNRLAEASEVRASLRSAWAGGERVRPDARY